MGRHSRGAYGNLAHLHRSANTLTDICAFDRTGSSGHQSEDGRPGMDLWRVLVVAVLQHGLNCDYDRLQELANRPQTVREMWGTAMGSTRSARVITSYPDAAADLSD